MMKGGLTSDNKGIKRVHALAMHAMKLILAVPQ